MEQRSEVKPDIAVALVEDDRGYRRALSLLLDTTPGFALAASYGSIEEALQVPPWRTPQVVLLDIKLPGLSGVDGVKRVKECFPGAIVLMLTVFEDEERIFQSLCNGADGYVLKRTPPTQLLAYVRDGADGGAPMSPEIARKVIRLFQKVPRPVNLECDLTDRERGVLALLADGHSYQGAARELEVSVNTIRKHVRSVYGKLHVHSMSEAVTKALRAGLI